VDRQAAIELLLEHYRSPHNREKQPDADVVMPGGNPGCGDIVTIYLKVDRPAEKIDRVTFEGEGCTISQAAASILTELVDGLPLSEIEAMDYHAIVDVIGTPPGFRGEPVDCPVPSDPVTRDEKGQAETLSDRELEVLRLLARGASNQEIADDLVITVGTVKSHINHIAVKLDVHNRTAAVARGRELGLLRI